MEAPPFGGCVHFTVVERLERWSSEVESDHPRRRYEGRLPPGVGA
jgi:hypothetical protein